MVLIRRALLVLVATAAQVGVGVALGLVLAEVLFTVRDHGAFPHLNVYQPDPELGVRLRPGATTTVRVADNDPTSVRINAHGFRGPEWPEPTPTEILVVGDSQVFGLGVEEDQTFAADLAQDRGVNVLDLGVPTWGPDEYTANLAEVLKDRHPATVVYVLNLANDLFELQHPNRDRHAVWDGWAVRKESAPAHVLWFPGRSWLMSRSHGMFALRSWFAGPLGAEGVASEGTWQDLVTTASTTTPPPPRDAAERAALEHRIELGYQLIALGNDLASAVDENILSNEAFAQGAVEFHPDGDLRDIVRQTSGEEARPIDVTAYHLLRASMAMDRNSGRLMEIARQSGSDDIVALLAKRKALRKELDSLRTDDDVGTEEPLDALIRKTRAATDAAGARLVVVALPLDVMVSADEWAKYPGVTPVDLAPAQVLVEDVVARAEAQNVTAVDPTFKLQAAEPGAFLHGDLHLTPTGHRAVAKAIEAALDQPPPRSELLLPPGRSWPPGDDEFYRVPQTTIAGITESRCQLWRVREWVRVECQWSGGVTEVDPTTGTSREIPFERSPVVKVRQGGHGDVVAVQSESGLVLTFPVLAGDDFRALIGWDAHARELVFSGDPQKVTFARTDPGPEGQAWEPTDGAAWLDSHPHAPCPAGRFGAFLRCARPCDPAADPDPCPGHCEPWTGSGFCAVP